MLQATTIVTRDGWRFWYQTITIYLKQHWIKMAYKKGKRQTHYFLQLHGSYQNYEFSYIEPHLFVAPLNLKQIIYDIRFILFIAGLVYGWWRVSYYEMYFCKINFEESFLKWVWTLHKRLIIHINILLLRMEKNAWSTPVTLHLHLSTSKHHTFQKPFSCT